MHWTATSPFTQVSLTSEPPGRKINERFFLAVVFMLELNRTRLTALTGIVLGSRVHMCFLLYYLVYSIIWLIRNGPYGGK